VIPLLYVLWMIRDQREVTVELRRRELRPIPFLVGIVSYILSIPLYFVAISTALPLILAIVGMHILNTFLITLITLRWKISVHTIALAGFFSIMFFIAQMPWQSLPTTFLDEPVLRRIAQLGCISLLPLLMWARVRAGAHTSRQVWAGALFGLFVPYIELFVLYRTGIL